MAAKQLTELEQAMADRAAAYKRLGTKQAALAKAHDAEREAKGEADKADKKVRDLLTREAEQAEAAALAAVGQEPAPKRRPPRPATQQQQLTDGERLVEHALTNGGSQVRA